MLVVRQFHGVIESERRPVVVAVRLPIGLDVFPVQLLDRRMPQLGFPCVAAKIEAVLLAFAGVVKLPPKVGPP